MVQKYLRASDARRQAFAPTTVEAYHAQLAQMIRHTATGAATLSSAATIGQEATNVNAASAAAAAIAVSTPPSAHAQSDAHIAGIHAGLPQAPQAQLHRAQQQQQQTQQDQTQQHGDAGLSSKLTWDLLQSQDTLMQHHFASVLRDAQSWMGLGQPSFPTSPLPPLAMHEHIAGMNDFLTSPLDTFFGSPAVTGVVVEPHAAALAMSMQQAQMQRNNSHLYPADTIQTSPSQAVHTTMTKRETPKKEAKKSSKNEK